MKKTIYTLALLHFIIIAQAQKVNVAAASNLRYVMEEIKTAYVKQQPKANINLTFGSSGTLVQQIINGANFDFFMAADNDFPMKLKSKGLTIGPMDTYAYGKLAIYSNKIDVEKTGLSALKDPKVRKIAVANPFTAPYGERTITMFKSLDLYADLQNKIVIADNISAAAQYAFTGNTELGFIAYSFALAPNMAGKGYCYIIPQKFYEPIEQACILIKTSILNTETVKFKKFVLSESMKVVWEKYGYGTVNN